jgi:hypothetical protein
MCAASALVLTSSSFDDVVGATSFATAAFDGTSRLEATPGASVIDARPAVEKDRAARVQAPSVTTATRRLSPSALDQDVRVVHGEAVLCAWASVSGHSLRAPPVSDEDSSDADQDDDDDDDDDDDFARTERTGSAAPANVNLLAAGDEHDRRPLYILPTLDTHLPSSFVFDVQSLRAPPR